MPKLTWDNIGERFYEAGVDRGVVYPASSDGKYPAGAAWNGLINVTLSPSGAEATPLYANNHKYLSLMSVEELGFSIEAYTYPEEFAECDGSKTLVPGVRFGQQKRKAFGFSYRTLVGNDTDGTSYGYKIHIIYNALASPSERANATVNDSPEAQTMNWECTTTPVEMDGFEPVSHIEIDSNDLDPEKLTALEEALYGTADKEAYLPLPADLATLVGYTAAE